MDRLNGWIIPQAEEEAAESYPDMDPESALEVILADEHCRAFYILKHIYRYL